MKIMLEELEFFTIRYQALKHANASSDTTLVAMFAYAYYFFNS